MYNITEFVGDYENHSMQAELAVVSVGCFLMDEFDSGSFRPDGLPDYQIVYINKGFCHLTLDTEIKIPAGSIILFKPNEPQIYSYHAEDESEVFWFHFTGKKAKKLLSDLGLYSKKTFLLYNGKIIKEAVYYMLKEIKVQHTNYETALAGKLISVLVEVSRNENNNLLFNNTKIDNVIRKIEKNYKSNETNSDYAEYCNMSVSHFISLFKKTTGVSPQQYKIQCKINNAKQILTHTDHSIKSVAYLVGFSDIGYFCKYFKKITGVTPSDYRKNNR